jgi:uncharacterized membrane protein YhaH (DUF805 family)
LPKIYFMKWYLMAFRKYAVFSGRSRRKEFWNFLLFHILCSILARFLDEIAGTNFPSQGTMGGGKVLLIYNLIVLIPAIALTVRRFHDIGKSGWVYFLFLSTLFLVSTVYTTYSAMMILKYKSFENLFEVGDFVLASAGFLLFIICAAVWILIMMVREGNHGSNKYGPDPKGAEDVLTDQLGI